MRLAKWEIEEIKKAAKSVFGERVKDLILENVEILNELKERVESISRN